MLQKLELIAVNEVGSASNYHLHQNQRRYLSKWWVIPQNECCFGTNNCQPDCLPCGHSDEGCKRVRLCKQWAYKNVVALVKSLQKCLWYLSKNVYCCNFTLFKSHSEHLFRNVVHKQYEAGKIVFLGLVGWKWDKVGLIPPHLRCYPPSHPLRPTHPPAALFDITLKGYLS